MKKLFLLTLCSIGLLALGSPAQASPIAGEIHFAGMWAPSGGASAGTATGVDFVRFQLVLDGTDDYAGLTGTGATFQDFTFAPFGGPVVPLWSFSSGGLLYSFDLEKVVVVYQDSTQLGLRGSGVLHIVDTDLSDGDSGRDDTPSTWDWTGNQGSRLFSFSTDNVAVPEPTTLGLLGLGLIGLTAAGKKQTRNA